MLTDREVISTLEMLKNEHLDVRAVTLGISLLDCASDDFGRFTTKVFNKIIRLAKGLVAACDDVGDMYGIPVVNKRLAVSPMAVVGAPFNTDQMIKAAGVLDRAGREVGVDFVGGFSALVEKGIAAGDLALLQAIPEALAGTERVCSSVNVASSRAGINMDAVALMGRVIKQAAELTRDRHGLACAKLVVFANIPQDVPFMAGAYLGIGEPDAVINVGVSGPGVVKKAIDRAMAAGGQAKRPTLGELSEVIKRTAFKVTRVGELIGSEPWPPRLHVPFGVVDLSLAPSRPTWGTAWARSFRAWGSRAIGVSPDPRPYLP